MNTIIKKIRDLTYVAMDEGTALVIACDSSGAVGMKTQDVVQVDNEMVGRLLCRVALMEVLASGAEPFLVVDTLSVEMNPSGKEIIAGIREEASLAGLLGDAVLTGSTEENFTVIQTGAGITVLGRVKPSEFKPGGARKGDTILCFGVPKVGEEVGIGGCDDPETANIALVLKLREMKDVHEILPVGSKGIAYEAQQICDGVGLSLRLANAIELDINKSAGPATCVLVAVDPLFNMKSIDVSCRMTILGQIW